MREGDVVIALFPQSDGSIKNRPALILREMPPFKDFLICGVSTQLRQKVEDFDEVISLTDSDFVQSGLISESLIRLGFLVTVPSNRIGGVIGSVSGERRKRLMRNLSSYLNQ